MLTPESADTPSSTVSGFGGPDRMATGRNESIRVLGDGTASAARSRGRVDSTDALSPGSTTRVIRPAPVRQNFTACAALGGPVSYGLVA